MGREGREGERERARARKTEIDRALVNSLLVLAETGDSRRFWWDPERVEMCLRTTGQRLELLEPSFPGLQLAATGLRSTKSLVSVCTAQH